ncbi:golgin subfamily A member 6-like protein 26 [Lepisosteus oculatus]|uniref:golgin subfamily A member 6-like protein 26 n=1 Tax=Lepisosteus oculatus TaxID=7918 RepID=UPI0037221AD4
MASGSLQQADEDATALTIVERLGDMLPLEELWRGQEETARWLHIAYLSLHDFPDVEAELRQNAVSCRQQQSLASNLISKFKATGYQILEDLIPQVRDAVELQDAELALDTIEMAKNWTAEMKEEATNTRDRYQKIIMDVNKNISTAKKKKQEVISEKQSLEQKAKMATEQKKLIEEKKGKYEEERKKVEEELASSKKKAKTLEEKHIKDDIDDDSRDPLTELLCPEPKTRRQKRKGGGGVLGFLGVTKIVEIMCDTEGKEREQDRKDREEVREQITKQREEMLKLSSSETSAAEEMIEKQAILEKLKNAQDMMGDESSLLTVVQHLAQVDAQLQRCIDFWEKMDSVLSLLSQKTEKGNPYLKKVEDERYRVKYLKTLDGSEKFWKAFGALCGRYVQITSGVEGKNLYAFLDGRADIMTKEERKKTIETLAEQLGGTAAPAIQSQ